MGDEQFSDDWSEPFGIENLLELARQIKCMGGSGLRDSKRSTFFRYALASYYDPFCSSMDLSAGDVIYRLSDLIQGEERRRINIYPNKSGNLITDLEGGIYGFTAWYTLEGWREEWQDRRRAIPELLSLLEPWQADYLKEF